MLPKLAPVRTTVAPSHDVPEAGAARFDAVDQVDPVDGPVRRDTDVELAVVPERETGWAAGPQDRAGGHDARDPVRRDSVDVPVAAVAEVDRAVGAHDGFVGHHETGHENLQARRIHRAELDETDGLARFGHDVEAPTSRIDGETKESVAPGNGDPGRVGYRVPGTQTADPARGRTFLGEIDRAVGTAGEPVGIDDAADVGPRGAAPNGERIAADRPIGSGDRHIGWRLVTGRNRRIQRRHIARLGRCIDVRWDDG